MRRSLLLALAGLLFLGLTASCGKKEEKQPAGEDEFQMRLEDGAGEAGDASRAG